MACSSSARAHPAPPHPPRTRIRRGVSPRRWSDFKLPTARMSYELHPPIGGGGTAVRNIANGVHAVCYVGDDGRPVTLGARSTRRRRPRDRAGGGAQRGGGARAARLGRSGGRRSHWRARPAAASARPGLVHLGLGGISSRRLQEVGQPVLRVRGDDVQASSVAGAALRGQRQGGARRRLAPRRTAGLTAVAPSSQTPAGRAQHTDSPGALTRVPSGHHRFQPVATGLTREHAGEGRRGDRPGKSSEGLEQDRRPARRGPPPG